MESVINWKGGYVEDENQNHNQFKKVYFVNYNLYQTNQSSPKINILKLYWIDVYHTKKYFTITI